MSSRLTCLMPSKKRLEAIYALLRVAFTTSKCNHSTWGFAAHFEVHRQQCSAGFVWQEGLKHVFGHVLKPAIATM